MAPAVEPMLAPKFFRQLYYICRKNGILQIRYWKSTLIQAVFAPIIIVLLLLALQAAINNILASANLKPTPTVMTGVSSCKVAYRSTKPCISMMYSPAGDPLYDEIMNNFVIRNNARVSPAWSIDTAKWTPDVSTLPSSSLSVVAVPSATFIYDFTLANPNITLYGISFSKDTTTVPGKTTIQYQIWYNHTESARKIRVTGAPAFVVGTIEPFNSEMVSLMRGIDEAIIISASTDKVSEEKLTIQLKDFPEFGDNPATGCPSNPDGTFASLGPLFLFIPMVVIFFSSLNNIVNEKEQHLKEAMEMVGLLPSVYWMGHFISISGMVLVNALVTTIIGRICQFSYFIKTDLFLVFWIYFMFGLASLSFVLFLASITSKVKIAIGIGFFYVIISVIYIATGALSTYPWYPAPGDTSDLSAVWKVLQFFPFFSYNKITRDIFGITGTTLAKTTTSCVVKEGDWFGWDALRRNVKATSSLSTATTTDHIPKPYESLWLFLMNIVVYLVLTVYLDKVIPNENGYSEHPLFFIFPSYYGMRDPAWMSRKTDESADRAKLKFPDNEDPDVAAERKLANDFNANGTAIDEAGLRIMNLYKRYDTSFKMIIGWGYRMFGQSGFGVKDLPDSLGTSKTAVHELSLVVQKGEMLALLGSNGAGKTSTMKIMYGSSPPSLGDAFIFGVNLRTQMREIKKFLGVCPQFDLLFPDLTAKEHVEMFCGIKGIAGDEMAKVSEQRLKHMKLWNVRDQVSSQYSGGMKRRLSVILSTLGDPKCVFLDEPTTGMDPVNKRYVWSFLEDFKKGRVIVLTTHSMEEADILADKIAIMSQGRLKAVGKSLHLKNKFGSGYRISLNLKEAKFIPTVEAKIKEVCPEANLFEETVLGTANGSKENLTVDGTVIASQTAHLVYVLETMKSVKTVIGFLEKVTKVQHENVDKANPDADVGSMITSFGLAQTTLEDVFLKTVKAESAVSPAVKA